MFFFCLKPFNSETENEILLSSDKTELKKIFGSMSTLSSSETE